MKDWPKTCHIRLILVETSSQMLVLSLVVKPLNTSHQVRAMFGAEARVLQMLSLLRSRSTLDTGQGRMLLWHLGMVPSLHQAGPANCVLCTK